MMKKVFNFGQGSYKGEDFQKLQDDFFDILPDVNPDMYVKSKKLSSPE